MKFIVRLLITAVALWVAVMIVPGIQHTGDSAKLLGVALVFGVVNATIRPILKLLTCPLVLLTLGLFIFVLNALMLWLTGYISQSLNLGFAVNGFFPALLGGVVVGIVSTVLNIVVGDKDERKPT